ncbi:MAG: hypothetical protein IJV35_03220 [Neisseriaceae bacterium]|nr:hypothetical protein [Neisseriaceae bacterium]
MKSKTLVILTAVLAVSSCASTKGDKNNQLSKETLAALEKMPKHDVAEPPYPAVPLLSQVLPNEIAKNRANLQSQIAKADGKTRVYFNKKADGQGNRAVVKNKTASEFYRVIYGQTQNGDCAVQNFYTANDTPLNEPVVLKKADCRKWNAGYVGDTLQMYYTPDGKSVQNPVVWLKNNQPQAFLAETQDAAVLTQPVAALMMKRTILNKTKAANEPRHLVVECVFNMQNRQIAYLTTYQANGVTKRFEMTNGQVNPQRIFVWLPTGHKVMDSYPADRLGNLQNTLVSMCGLN